LGGGLGEPLVSNPGEDLWGEGLLKQLPSVLASEFEALRKGLPGALMFESIMKSIVVQWWGEGTKSDLNQVSLNEKLRFSFYSLTTFLDYRINVVDVNMTTSTAQ